MSCPVRPLHTSPPSSMDGHRTSTYSGGSLLPPPPRPLAKSKIRGLQEYPQAKPENRTRDHQIRNQMYDHKDASNKLTYAGLNRYKRVLGLAMTY
jgi:hypothetical protein